MNDERLGLRIDDAINITVFSTHKNVKIRLYKDDEDIFGIEFDMRNDGDYHSVRLSKKYELWQYVFVVDSNEVTDPNSIALSVNSKRSVIVDLKKTDPEGFDEHKFNIKRGPKVIYELHIKDFTYYTGAKYNGRYLGMCETGLECEGQSIGLDHLVELGVTHVHLMPVYDYLTVREESEYFDDDLNYNWGYDPEHYNVPEGSYASDVYDPASRIRDLKQMIMTLHENGIGVIMDVVYNHTFRGLESNFHVLAPFYFHRSYNGRLTDGSGCGNEINTQRKEVRDFIINSLKFWVREYKIDGFRFDLWGLMDVETAYIIEEELHRINPDIFLYGEPWTGGLSNLVYEQQVKKGVQYGRRLALFNDDFRNVIKGDNNGSSWGYCQGNFGLKAKVETGFLGSVDYDWEHKGFTFDASESINYVNSHDDLCLRDKLFNSNHGVEEKVVKRQYKLALALNILAMGNAFLTEGNEFFRNKQMIANTYNCPISINGIRWEGKRKHVDIFDFTKKLIDMKKRFDVFHYTDACDIRNNIDIIKELPDSQMGFELRGKSGKYKLFFNCGDEDLPKPRGYIIFEDEVLRFERFGL